jgi:hypothetical protein
MTRQEESLEEESYRRDHWGRHWGRHLAGSRGLQETLRCSRKLPEAAGFQFYAMFLRVGVTK